jgi:hypothetical protein
MWPCVWTDTQKWSGMVVQQAQLFEHFGWVFREMKMATFLG